MASSTDLITPTIADAITAARSALKALGDATREQAISEHHAGGKNNLGASELLSYGRLDAAAETAGDALFDVLNIASSHLGSPEAARAIAAAR